MSDNVAEQVSVRLNEEQKRLLDAYHAKRPALSRAGCFVQMLYDLAWQAEENSKTAKLKRIEETLVIHSNALERVEEAIEALRWIVDPPVDENGFRLKRKDEINHDL